MRESVTASGAVVRCARCGRPVFGYPRYHVSGLTYHADCFAIVFYSDQGQMGTADWIRMRDAIRDERGQK